VAGLFIIMISKKRPTTTIANTSSTFMKISKFGLDILYVEDDWWRKRVGEEECWAGFYNSLVGCHVEQVV
jgi:hypothetical protein